MSDAEAELARIRAREKRRGDRFRRSTRARALERYGGKCVCCGEANLAFLTIPASRKDRATVKKPLYRHLATAALEAERWSVMCVNCEFARRTAGSCPHSTPTATTDSMETRHRAHSGNEAARLAP